MPETTLDKISRLRKLQKESHQLIEELQDSLAPNCKEGLLDVLDNVLDSTDEFADSESVLRVFDELTTKTKKKERSSKKDKKDKRR